MLDADGCCDQCYIIKHRFLRCKGSNLSLRLSWTVVLFEDPPKVGWVGPFGDQRLVRLGDPLGDPSQAWQVDHLGSSSQVLWAGRFGD